MSSTAWTYTDIETTEEIAGLPDGPGVVVGSQVRLPADSNTYTLYYLYPLDEQQRTLALVSRAMLVAGVPLLLLVAGLTWLVTRQVVTPIRMARRVAERLAAGQLQERLRVRGEDDLARLATSFNQMASNLQKQIRQLEELSRLQRRFVSDVSHELRTPITTVRMASDVIHDARPFLDPVTGRAAELLQKELDRFETLLADLLEISRFDAGAAVLEAEDVNLVDVARRVVDMTSALAAQRDTRVVVHDPGVPCVAEADVRRVERIVRNLVTNAIDHAESRDVEIFIGADRQSAAIAVRDHGIGLGPGESAMVFNRFWRADPARARTSGGTGLGLSISLEDTHLHGGWLQAWGRPGEGAQFRLTLPRHLGHPAAALARSRSSPTTPGRPHEDPARHAPLAAVAALRPPRGVRLDADRRPGRRAAGLQRHRRRARHLVRPAAAAGRGVGARDRRGLPRGDEGDADQHDGRAPVPLGGGGRRVGRRSEQIITYAEPGTASGEASVRLPLTDINVYDERGAWQRTQAERDLELGLVQEDGEWRIDSVPDALIVPDSWFDDWYQRVVPLLLRPHLRGAGRRARLRAPGRPVRLVARDAGS